MFYRRNYSGTQRYRDSRDRENSVHKYRFCLSYPRRGKSAVCSKHRRETFHPDISSYETSVGQPARVGALFFFFYATFSSLCAYSRKKQAPTTRLHDPSHDRLQGRVHTHPRTHSHHLYASDMQMPRHMHIYVCARARASARASRDRGGKFHSRIHSPRKQIPSLSRIY
ncbi:hypothetical protein ACS0PU_008427 [Formica fusca]